MSETTSVVGLLGTLIERLAEKLKCVNDHQHYCLDCDRSFGPELLDEIDAAVKALPPAPPQEQEPSWRCFHCDEVFTDKVDAQDHFGDYPDDSPLCLVKGQDGGFGARIRELEHELAHAFNQRNEAENDARLWHESEADRVRRIGHVQWWQELDSKQGEILALREQLAASPPAQAQDEQRWALIEEALDTKELKTDLARLSAIGSIVQSRKPFTDAEIRRSHELARELGWK